MIVERLVPEALSDAAQALRQQLLADKDTARWVEAVIGQPSLAEPLLEIVRCDPGSLKYRCSKIIRMTAERRPELVYPFFREIAAWLDSPNSFIRWDGMLTIGLLLAADRDDLFPEIYERFAGLIDDASMITAANAIGQAARMIRTHPALEPDLTRRLLRVAGNTYWYKGQPSPECWNIVCGAALDSFAEYWPQASQKPAILAFAASLCQNSRPAVARKAARFLKEHAPV